MNARTLDRSARTHTALRITLAVLAVAVSGAFATFGGCVLPTEGLPSPDGGGGAAPTSCNVNDDCDDHNPCTSDVCGADKLCQNTPQETGAAPASQQVAGDCKTIICTAGKPSEMNDQTDVPPSTDDCETPSCNMGMPFQNPKTDGTPCTLATPTGEVDGTCLSAQCTVHCSPTMSCPDVGPCQTPSCDVSTGTCVYTNLPDGTPTPNVTQMPGTCQDNVCIGGQPMSEEDDSNVPVTTNDCVTPTCTAGAPSTPSKAEDMNCATLAGGALGVCDGNGTCVQCNHDMQCAGTSPDTDCQHPVCQANKCVPSFIAQGTPTNMNPAQVQGDCQQIQCDGSGNTMTVYDASDPASDGNPCHMGMCTAPNMTTQNDIADGTVCGASGALACLGGVCSGCTMASQCVAASCSGNTLTKSQTCNAGACVNPAPPTELCDPYVCSASTDACTTKCNVDGDCAQSGVGNYCTGANGSCDAKLAQGAACTAGHQCQNGNCVDGFCCSSSCTGTCLACSHALTGSANGTCSAVATGTDPKNQCASTNPNTCGTDGLCSGTVCADYASGTVCAAATCSGSTLTFAHTCNGTGTCNTPSPTTTSCAPNLCNAAGTACATSCAMDSNCASTGYCNGGMCVNKQPLAASCTAADQCMSGFCADGFCCNAACTGVCDACAASLQQPGGGGTGTCSPSVNGMSSPAGHMACANQMMSTCGTDGTCQAGACHDWVSGTVCAAASCSNSTDTETFASTCNGTGTCTAPSPASMSCGPYACNGAVCYTSCTTSSQCASGFACAGGVCLGATGSACTMTTQCASGFCADGFCCNSACNTACQACAASLQQSGGGGNGTCSPATNGQPDPRGMCATTASTTCGTDGACQGGVCQDWSSTTTCSSLQGCAGSTQQFATTCSGSGACTGTVMGTPCAGGYACIGIGNNNCNTSCGSAGPTGDAKCTSGYYCDGVGMGACQPQKAIGGTCGGNDQCTNGSCVGGICCSSASCSGGCFTGTCSTGSCDVHAPDYVCANGTCNGDMLQGLGVCDGTTGTCHVDSNFTCQTGTCTPTGCSSCNNDNLCSQPYGYCNTSVCAAAGVSGASCTANDQCVSGQCNQAGNTKCM